MNLAACPNCSSCSPGLDTPVIGRPQLVRGQHTGRFFISGCCDFSSNSRTPYDTEKAASDAWDKYRASMARKYASEGLPRRANCLREIDDRERFIFAKRLPASQP